MASIASWISLGTDVTAGAHGLWGGYNHKWRETAQTTSQDERQTRAFRRSIAYIAALTTAKYVFSDISESLEPAIEAGKTAAWGLGGLLLPYAGRVIGKVGYAIWNALPSPDKN